MKPDANKSSFYLFASLVVTIIAIVILSLIGKADMVSNTVLILGGCVTTVAGALAGFSQHPAPPAQPGASTLPPNSPAPQGQKEQTT